MAPKMALKSGTQDDTEGDTQMITKNKLLTSSTILYLPKTKLGNLLTTSQLPLVYMCTYIHESSHEGQGH